jgi:hypothetical protein
MQKFIMLTSSFKRILFIEQGLIALIRQDRGIPCLERPFWKNTPEKRKGIWCENGDKSNDFNCTSQKTF